MPNEEYEKAYIEIIRLNARDIITASNAGDIDEDTGDFPFIDPEE